MITHLQEIRRVLMEVGNYPETVQLVENLIKELDDEQLEIDEIDHLLRINKEEARALYIYFHTSAGFIHNVKHGKVHAFINRLAGFLKHDEHKPYDENRRKDD